MRRCIERDVRRLYESVCASPDQCNVNIVMRRNLLKKAEDKHTVLNEQRNTWLALNDKEKKVMIATAKLKIAAFMAKKGRTQ